MMMTIESHWRKIDTHVQFSSIQSISDSLLQVQQPSFALSRTIIIMCTTMTVKITRATFKCDFKGFNFSCSVLVRKHMQRTMMPAGHLKFHLNI